MVIQCLSKNGFGFAIEEFMEAEAKGRCIHRAGAKRAPNYVAPIWIENTVFEAFLYHVLLGLSVCHKLFILWHSVVDPD